MADDTGRSGSATRTRLVTLLAGIIRWFGLVVALILVLHVILVAGEANPTNVIARTLSTLADSLSLAFKDLFTPTDPKLRTLVNYGLAALFWLTLTSLLSRLLLRLT